MVSQKVPKLLQFQKKIEIIFFVVILQNLKNWKCMAAQESNFYMCLFMLVYTLYKIIIEIIIDSCTSMLLMSISRNTLEEPNTFICL